SSGQISGPAAWTITAYGVLPSDMYTNWEKSSTKLPHEIITIGEGNEEIQSLVRFSHLRRKAAEEESRLRIRNAKGARVGRKVTTAPLVASSSRGRGMQGHSFVCV